METISKKIIACYRLFDSTVFHSSCDLSFDSFSDDVIRTILKYVYSNGRTYEENNYECLEMSFDEESLIVPFENTLQEIEVRILVDWLVIFQNILKNGTTHFAQKEYIQKYCNGLKKEFGIKD